MNEDDSDQANAGATPDQALAPGAESSAPALPRLSRPEAEADDGAPQEAHGVAEVLSAGVVQNGGAVSPTGKAKSHAFLAVFRDLWCSIRATGIYQKLNVQFEKITSQEKVEAGEFLFGAFLVYALLRIIGEFFISPFAVFTRLLLAFTIAFGVILVVHLYRAAKRCCTWRSAGWTMVCVAFWSIAATTMFLLLRTDEARERQDRDRRYADAVGRIVDERMNLGQLPRFERNKVELLPLELKKLTATP